MNTTSPRLTSRYDRIAFIDTNVERADLLARHLRPGTKAVFLDARRSAFEQIDCALSQESELRAVDVISHARPGVLGFAGGEVGLEELGRWRSRLGRWRSALAAEAEWLFYGCQLAAGRVGRQFVEAFGQSLGVTVAAASHTVGAATGGGRWDLDVAIGDRRVGLAVGAIGQAQYPATLQLQNSVFISSSNGTAGEISTISLADGSATKVGDLPYRTNSLARQFVNLSDPGTLFGISLVQDTGNARLFSFDPSNPAATPAVDVELRLNDAPVTAPNSNNFQKFTQAKDGTLYATQTNNFLYTINPVPVDDPANPGTNIAIVTAIGQIDFPDVANDSGGGDIAFNPNNPNQLFVTRIGSGSFSLYTVNLNTSGSTPSISSVTKIGNVTDSSGFPGVTSSGAGTLAFGSDGNLYLSGRVGSTDGDPIGLFRVSTSDASATQVATLGINPSDFASFPIPSIALDLAVDKSDGCTVTADPGDAVTYTVSVEYKGARDPVTGNLVTDFPVSGIKIEDVLPSDLQNASWVRTLSTGNTVGTDGKLTGGTVTQTVNGTGNINDTIDNLNGGSVITYTITGTLATSLVGDDTITNQITITADGFTIVNPDGSLTTSISDSDSLTINNVPPVPVDAVNTVSPNEAVQLTGLFATDPEGDDIRGFVLDRPTTGTLFLGDPNNGGTAITFTNGKSPELTPAQLATVFYQADGTFTGESFTYTATDVKGSTSEPATVRLNPPPTATDDSTTVTPGSQNALPDDILSGTDTNAGGSISQFRLTSLPTGGTLFAEVNGNLVPVTTTTNLTPAQVATLVFQADPNFSGPTTFNFVSIDNDGAASSPATVTLNSGNAPPTTIGDPITTAPAGTPTTLTGLGGSDDVTPEAALLYEIDDIPDPSLGTLTYTSRTGATVTVTSATTINSTELGTLTFTPTTDTSIWQEGSTASFTYAAIDANNLKDPTPARAYIKASDPTNVPPETFAIPSTFGSTSSVPAGAATQLAGLGGNDPDGTIRGFKFTTLPPANQGVLYLGDPANGGRIITQGEEIPADQIGNIFFDATDSYSGATFAYAAVDNQGREDASPAPITLTEGNAPPETADVSTNALSNAIVPIGEQLSGTDADGSASFTIDTLPPSSQGVLYLGGPPSAGGVAVTAGTVLTPDQVKLLYFVASGNFSGASFTYSATDTQGNTDPTPATVSIGGNNAAPETLDVGANVGAGQQVTLAGLGGSDTDGTVAFFEIDSLPAAAQGVLFLGDPANGRTIQVGDRLTQAELATLVFVATADFVGTTFTYSAIDNLGLKDPTPATVTLGTPAPQQSFDALLNAGSSSGSGASGAATVVVAGPCDTPDEPAMPTVERLDELAEPSAISLPEIAISNVPEIASSQLGTDGDESLFGGAGNDSLRGELGSDEILGLSGRDVLIGGISSDTPVGGTRDRDFLAGNEDDDIILASEGEDTAFGGQGNDLVFAGKDDDLVWGDLGDDTISGDSGNDQIAGGEFDPNPEADSGADLIVGGGGNDSLNGNNNADTLSGGADDDLVEGGQGNDIVLGNGGRDVLRGNRDDDTLYGGDPGSDAATDTDILHGDTGNDLLYGGVGADTLYSGKGDDVAFGGSEDDVIYGDLGGDTLSGNDGNDTIAGSNGAPGSVDSLAGDVLFGNAGDDFLAGNDGNDTIQGGTGDDIVLAGKDADRVFGDEGADTIAGERGNDTIVGDRENGGGDPADANDLLFGNNENDLIKGGIGDDFIFAGRDDDLVYGESGNDFVYGDRGKDTLLGNEGSDTILGDTADFTIVDADGDDIIFGGAGTDLLFGGNGDDTVIGGADNDTARGGKGDDRLYGDGGNDLLFGDLGNDTICAHEGDDTLVGHNGLNSAEDGNDYMIADAGNDLLLANIGDDILDAGDGNDCLYGGQGNDSLLGGAGNDLLSGDRGNDTLVGGAGSDRFVIGPGKGVETISDFSTVEDFIALDGVNFSELTFLATNAGLQIQLGDEVLAIVTNITASSLSFDRFTTDISCGDGAADDGLCPAEPTFDVASVAIGDTFASVQIGGDAVDAIIGVTGADSIVGDVGNDLIRGGSGDDIIRGGKGITANANSENDRDFLAGNEGRDVIFGNEGNDTILAGKDDDVVLAGKNDDLVYGDLGSDTLLGELGNDTIIGSTIDQNVADPGSDLIFGNDGNDVLSGNQGADSLVGGAGDDVIFGGQENDILWGGEGNDLLTGDRGTDTLCGGAGDDTLTGGTDDRLVGDAGNDTFLLSRTSLAVTIADFQAGDTVGLSGDLTFAELSIVDTTSGATIAAGGTTIALVSGVTAATLTEDRFTAGL